MNILVEAGDLNPPFVEGTRNIVLTHIKELIKRGHQITILTKKKEGHTQKKFDSFELRDGIKIYRWSNYLDLFFTLRKIKSREKIEIIHSFAKGLRPAVYLKFLRKNFNCPIILSILGFPFVEYKKSSFKSVLKEITLLTISSKTVFNYLKAIEKSPKINYVPYGIDTDRFKPEKKDKLIIYLRIPDTSLINAFRRFHKENPNYKLILDKNATISFAKEISSKIVQEKIKGIEYIEFLEDISQLFNKSETLIEIHPKGNFIPCASPPLQVLEAMSSGTKIIASDVPEINEFIKNNQNGLLLEYNNEKEIYTKLKGSIKIKDTLVKNARKTILTQFNLKEQTNIFEKIYRDLIQKNNL